MAAGVVAMGVGCVVAIDRFALRLYRWASLFGLIGGCIRSVRLARRVAHAARVGKTEAVRRGGCGAVPASARGGKPRSVGVGTRLVGILVT